MPDPKRNMEGRTAMESFRRRRRPDWIVTTVIWLSGVLLALLVFALAAQAVALEPPVPAAAKCPPGERISQASPARVDVSVRIFAGRHGVPLPVARAFVAVESSYRDVCGPVGEYGPMQVTLAAALDMGCPVHRLRSLDVSVDCGMRYLAWLLRRMESLDQAAYAYHRGPWRPYDAEHWYTARIRAAMGRD